MHMKALDNLRGVPVVAFFTPTIDCNTERSLEFN
jgi:hypothetical protein